jgi:hypothetical protein
MKTTRDSKLKWHAVRFAVLKQSPDGQPFWPITSPPPPKVSARRALLNGRAELFLFPGQHDISRGDLLTGYSGYYLVRHVRVEGNSCLVLAAWIFHKHIVRLPDRIYLKHDFVKVHKPKPIDDLAAFLASLTIGDAFADRWPPESDRANIYIFRDADVIFYIGSSATSVYNRVRAHLGIDPLRCGEFALTDLVHDNLPDSRSWKIDLYKVYSTNVGDILRHEAQIIRRLCPIINKQYNPCPMPLPMHYKWRWRFAYLNSPALANPNVGGGGSDQIDTWMVLK